MTRSVGLHGQRIFNDTFGREGREWSSLSVVERAYYNGLANEYKALVQAQTNEDIVKALKNSGVNTECGACMEVAFTGVTMATHECTNKKLPPVVMCADESELLPTKTCGNCLNRCMDMDMDPYCAAVNKPHGLTLRRGRPDACSKFELWQKDTR